MSSIHYSPLTATAVGPAGPPSKLSVGPYSGPSTALLVIASSVVSETDFQWVQLGLTVPDGTTIRGVVVCYKVITAKPDSTYISQTRLTEMTTPNVATVRHDDGTNLTSTAPVCYTSKGSAFAVKGTMTLELKMVFGSTSDKILIGGLSLLI
jgi:hypothetical protein